MGKQPRNRGPYLLRQTASSESHTNQPHGSAGPLLPRKCRCRWIPGSLGIQGCPYAYGFDVAKSSLEWINEAQEKSIGIFINPAYGDRFKLYTRVRAAALRENWNTLKSMPMLTYPPFSLYDCRSHTQAKRFERTEEIPNIDVLRVKRKFTIEDESETGLTLPQRAISSPISSKYLALMRINASPLSTNASIRQSDLLGCYGKLLNRPESVHTLVGRSSYRFI